MIHRMKTLMIFQKRIFTSLFWILALLFLTMVGCTQPEEISEMWENHPPPQAYVPADDEPNPCTGYLSIPAVYTILEAADYPGYDLAVAVSFSSPPEPPQGCMCSKTTFCITLSFPQEMVTRAGRSQLSDPEHRVSSIAKNGVGGYIRHEDPRVNYPGTSTGGSIVRHSLCSSNGPYVILFNFPHGLPSGYDISNVVQSASGICIIDNIPDPNP